LGTCEHIAASHSSASNVFVFKAAFRLYTDLAALTKDDQSKIAFQMLAQEEANHKLRFEIEYDDAFPDE